MASQPKRPASKKPASNRDTLAKLRKDVVDIEVRLSRANSLTNSSVKSLRTAFEALSERSGKNAEQLALPLEQLSHRLTSMIDQTRADVAHDLQVVLSDPRIDTLGAALTKANRRLSAAEAEQAETISQINEQIAVLATAVDKRLRLETQSREKQNAVIQERIETIETQSAAAIGLVGDKVVEFSKDLSQRADDTLDDLKRQANTHILEKEQALEEFKSELERRVESIEDAQRNSVPSIERRLVTLASRLDVLEDTASTQLNGTLQGPPPAVYDPQPGAQTVETEQSLKQEIAQSARQSSSTTAQPIDAFTPNIPPKTTPVSAPAPAPAPAPSVPAQMQAELESAMRRDESTPFEPVEYTPAQPNQSLDAPGFTTANPYANPQPGQNFDPIYGVNPLTATELPPMPDAHSALPNQAEIYELPEVANAPESLGNTRPGASKPQKPEKKRGLSKPLKMAVLMASVAVIGIMAGKTLLPKFLGKDTPAQVASVGSHVAPAGTTEQAAPAMPGSFDLTPSEAETIDAADPTNPVNAPAIGTMETVGDYSEGMSAPDLGETATDGEANDNRLTLTSAAIGGNAIAQFQLGLSNLESGNVDEAVRLIRLSANQNQPAAQYRLAKLYESGVGVKPDQKTAMNLLERAADNGNRIAMHDLGHYHAQDMPNKPADIQKAAEMFTKAAERGVLDSQYNLAVLYQQGLGVPKSLVDAYVWFSIAGAQGDTDAAERGKTLAPELSREEMQQANTRIQAFTPKRINEPANGIFRNLPWTLPSAQNKADVKTAQKMLAKLGYDVGAADGAMGPKTRNAVIQFERANGLPETGRVNAALMQRLNLAAGA